MSFDFSSRVRGCARPVLAALAILAVLSLATPSASASITLTYTASADAMTNSAGSPAPNSLTTGLQTVGNFTYSLTATTNDPGGGTTSFPGSSSLSNITLAINSTGGATDTLDILLTGAGFTLTGNLLANFTVSGSSAKSAIGDTTTANSMINATAIPTMAGTTVTGTPLSPGPLTTPYTWTGGAHPPLGDSNTLAFTNSTTFSEVQHLVITLGAGDNVTLTFNTAVVLNSVPEPSSLVLGGIGALGLIGYGLRRRKALGA